MSSNFWYLNSNLWGRGWRKNAILMLILFKTNELKKTCKSEIVNLSYSPWTIPYIFLNCTYTLFLLLDPWFQIYIRDFGKQFSCPLYLTIIATVYNFFTITKLPSCSTCTYSFFFIYLFECIPSVHAFETLQQVKNHRHKTVCRQKEKTCLKVRLWCIIQKFGSSKSSGKWMC